MIHGFLFGMGFFVSLIVVLILLMLMKKLRMRRPTVLMWKEYRRKAIDSEQYDEVVFVDNLIAGKNDEDKTPMPRGYKIEEKANTILNDGGGDEVSIRVDKVYWIVKVQKRST
jgi:hypothetical protein